MRKAPMNFELRSGTAAGERLVALAEAHATDFATRTAQHDREGSFPFENIAAMQRSGVMAACVPEELGGLGVESVHAGELATSRTAPCPGATATSEPAHLCSHLPRMRHLSTLAK